MGRAAMMTLGALAAAGCSILIDSSQYTGGTLDGGADAGADAAPSCVEADGAVAVCGDCVAVEGVEACDDGNTVGGDGCNATCEIEEQVGSGGCEAPFELRFVRGPEGLVAGAAGNTSVGGGSTAEPGCTPPTMAPDDAFRFTVPTGGRPVDVYADPRTDWDLVLHLRTACADPDTEAACANDGGPAGYEILSSTLPAGSYDLIIDGLNENDHGDYGVEVYLYDP
jgi:cysteine-rich repeat protein